MTKRSDLVRPLVLLQLSLVLLLLLSKTSTVLPVGAERVDAYSLDEFDPAATDHGRALRRHQRGQAESAVAILSTDFVRDLDDLCRTLTSLELLKSSSSSNDDQNNNSATEQHEFYKRDPVLIFNEGNLLPEHMDRLVTCGRGRPIGFPTIKLSDRYPPNFPPPQHEWDEFQKNHPPLVDDHTNNNNVKHGRKDSTIFGDAQVVRFWTTRVWEHPVTQQFERLLRLDTDSCFLEGARRNPAFDRLPHLLPRYVYQTVVDPSSAVQHPYYRPQDTSPVAPPLKCEQRSDGLYDFARTYINSHHDDLLPRSPKSWDVVVQSWERHCRLPAFENHVEVMVRSFFQRPDVAAWHHALTEEEPFGVYRHAWSERNTRFLTMALFANDGDVLISSLEGYEHGSSVCAASDVEGMVYRHEQQTASQREEEESY